MAMISSKLQNPNSKKEHGYKAGKCQRTLFSEQGKYIIKAGEIQW